MPIDLRSANGTQTVEVKENEHGELYIDIPENILKELDWTEDTMLVWSDNKDGSWTLKKKREMIPPELTENMQEVREGVDEIDRQLIDLLITRYKFMDAAARIKNDKYKVRDEVRKSQVIDNVCTLVKNSSVPEETVKTIWNILIESCIAYEMKKWQEMREHTQ
jgi:isochorismate pyruvate lyase